MSTILGFRLSRHATYRLGKRDIKRSEVLEALKGSGRRQMDDNGDESKRSRENVYIYKYQIGKKIVMVVADIVEKVVITLYVYSKEVKKSKNKRDEKHKYFCRSKGKKLDLSEKTKRYKRNKTNLKTGGKL